MLKRVGSSWQTRSLSARCFALAFGRCFALGCAILGASHTASGANELAPPRAEGYPTQPPYHEGASQPDSGDESTANPGNDSNSDAGVPATPSQPTQPQAPHPKSPLSSTAAPAPNDGDCDDGKPSYEKSGIEYRFARCHSSTDNSSLVIEFNTIKRNGRSLSKVLHTGGPDGSNQFEAEAAITETFYRNFNNWGSELSWVLISPAGHLVRISGNQNAPYGAVMAATATYYLPGSGQYVKYGCTIMGLSRLSHIFEIED